MEALLSINPNRVDVHEAYLRMAEGWGKNRSKANRAQVGAIIVKGTQVISDGYNGMPHAAPDDVCEYYDTMGALRTKPEVLHAESNAFMKLAAEGGMGCKGGILYTTIAPCFDCAKLVIQAKIAKVYYRWDYRDPAGKKLCESFGIPVIQLIGE